MSCFLSLGRINSAFLVTDFGKCKELHFCIEKHRNRVEINIEINDFASTIWNTICACEEQIEIEKIQQILPKEKNDS